MSKPKQAVHRQIIRLTSLVLVLIVLPVLLLLPAGVIWLWERGWVYWWLLLAAVLTLGGYLFARWIQRRLAPVERPKDSDQTQDTDAPVAEPDANWSPQDLEAWREVQTLAQQTDRDILASQTLLLQRARTVIDRVALHYYPEHKDPIWNFTLPEALLLSERISQRLRLVLIEHVPAAHMIQVGQIMRLWQLKTTSQKFYQGAYFAYRLVRWVNPVAAILAEARERVLEVAFGSTSNYLRQKGARIWVEEVGRAAIELYSGRLHGDPQQLADLATQETVARPVPGPVQVLIAGQVNVGKSSLVNALLQDSQVAVDLLPMTTGSERYQLTNEGEPIAVLIDTPGITSGHSSAWWHRQCAEVDCLVWVVAAHRADRELDLRALETLRENFRGQPQRSMPPVLVVVSH
ncbi:MAG: GTPase domain-containing protein, partial [Natronospirillum sp.]